MRVFRSADRSWRIEQRRNDIRVYHTTGAGWVLQMECRSVAELNAWLHERGDPVDEWVED